MDQTGKYDFKEGRNNNSTTLVEKAGVAGCILATPPLMIAWSLTYPFKSYRQLPFKDQLFANVEGYFTKSLNIRQLRTLVPIQPVRKVLAGYSRRARKKGLRNFNGYFGGENYSARWIHEVPDRTETDPILIYIHGGGYALKLSSVQVGYVLEFAEAHAKKRVSILCFDYTVTPFARYPDQLKELVALYKDLSKICTSISVLGDSCGCHAAIQLCSHSGNPVDGVEPVDVKLYSLIFYSPWCGLDVSVGGSYDIYNDKDIIDKSSSKEMQSMYCDNSLLLDSSVNPVLETNPDFWKKVLPSKIVVVYGEYEILGDGIKKWSKNAGVEHIFEEPAGVHDAMLLGFNSPSTKYICEIMNQWF